MKKYRCDCDPWADSPSMTSSSFLSQIQCQCKHGVDFCLNLKLKCNVKASYICVSLANNNKIVVRLCVSNRQYFNIVSAKFRQLLSLFCNVTATLLHDPIEEHLGANFGQHSSAASNSITSTQ